MEVVFGLVEDSESSDSSRDSSSSEGGSAYLNAFETFFSLPLMRPKIGNFIDDTVHRYSDNGFRRNFRLSRDVCDTLVRGFAASPYNPAGNRGGSPPKSPEEHVLAFLWNKLSPHRTSVPVWLLLTSSHIFGDPNVSLLPATKIKPWTNTKAITIRPLVLPRSTLPTSNCQAFGTTTQPSGLSGFNK
ncbi:uncharacterized protein LOC135373148 isoform X3 [Ornithodoros turicata]|uniref:uncharacterized protein LOC135373148 isoform X3 n=1 Tax=Ornithodoros turicata TaxID=34597 RepID=UPI00313873B3